MGITVTGKSQFSTPAEGLVDGACVDVVDLGMIDGQFGQRAMVKLVWEIAEENPHSKAPFTVSRRFGATLGKKSSLRPFLEGWRGKKFTPEELESFDLEKLLNAPCQLQIIHNLGDDGSLWANVQAAIPASKHSKYTPSGTYIREIDRVVDGPEGPATGDEDAVPF